MFLRLLALTALVSLAHRPAYAQGTLIESADPTVRAALLADGGDAARIALDSIAARGAIDRALIERALAMPLFASHARATLIALAQVDRVPGAKRTLERVVAAQDEGNVVGAAFEIQAAALLGSERVAAIGTEVDGHEVDLLLFDGTRVEVKYQRNDDIDLSARIVRKATDQLRKRGAYGDPVMLVTNNPLTPGDLQEFRRAVGAASSVMVVEDGRLVRQLAPAALKGVERLRRTAFSGVRRKAHRSAHRVARRVRSARKVKARAR